MRKSPAPLRNEAEFWKLTRDYLRAFANGRAYRIETRITSGVPDVICLLNGSLMTLELKYIKQPPKRDATKVKIRLSDDQIDFHMNAPHLKSLIAVTIEGLCLVFGGQDALVLSQGMTMSELIEIAINAEDTSILGMVRSIIDLSLDNT